MCVLKYFLQDLRVQRWIRDLEGIVLEGMGEACCDGFVSTSQPESLDSQESEFTVENKWLL